MSKPWNKIRWQAANARLANRPFENLFADKNEPVGTMMTNIDSIRAEIMRLENEPIFDQHAWARVLIALTDQPCRRADAARRMQTARQNARWIGGVDVGTGPDVTAYWQPAVSTETEVMG